MQGALFFVEYLSGIDIHLVRNKFLRISSALSMAKSSCSWEESSKESKKLCQELLCPDEAVPDIDSIRALHDAEGTIAASYSKNFL